MPSTSVHFPAPLLEDLDQLAAETGTSRNRLIVEACRETLQKRLAWPKRFFDDDRFSEEDLLLLQTTASDFEAGLLTARRTRDHSPF